MELHPALEEINPYIRRAWYHEMDQQWMIRERVIFDYELLYVMAGGARITIESETYEAQAGDVFLFRPGQRHSLAVESAMPLVQPHVHFDLMCYPDRREIPISFKPIEEMNDAERAQIRPDIMAELFPGFPSRIHLKNPLLVERYLFDVIRAPNEADPYWQLRQKWMFLRLLNQLLREIGWQHGSSKKERAEAIRVYLEQNSGRRITLAELADTEYIDKSYLVRLFRECYGVTPLRYHLRLRVEKAKDLIVYTSMPLTEIAELTGFASIHDFSRVFKRVDGEAPSHYRKHRMPDGDVILKKED